MEPGTRATLAPHHLDALIRELKQRSYHVVGPALGDGAILYREINSVSDLPVGWTEEQSPGAYRLQPRSDKALFGFTVGPDSWKKFLFPPTHKLWRARRNDGGFEILSQEQSEPPRYAFLGVRACELHAIAIQDKVFLHGPQVDPIYQSRRQSAFLIAVNCAVAADTCFCVSMQTGPNADSGFDLALTEIIEENDHYLVVEVGTPLGGDVLARIPSQPAQDRHRQRARATVERTAATMRRKMDTAGIRELLQKNAEHPRWNETASRCLTCANCTLVCPTCFCSTVEDVTDLQGDNAERWRKWDSCFTMDFSYIHGGSVRASAKSRYRQWLTHKLSTWHDQFESSGCVGCGRCITWCPVGIDLTEEIRALRQSPGAKIGATQEVGDENA